MVSFIREGSDYMTCRECGDRFDLNDVDRKDLRGGRFQPYCIRCAKSEERANRVSCISCGDFYSVNEVQFAYHVHPDMDMEKISICSQKCAKKHVKATSPWSACYVGNEYDSYTSYEELLNDFNEEIQEEESEKYKSSVRKKYIAFSAALEISNNRREAHVDTSLASPDSDYLPIVITPRWETADFEYVKKFHLLEFKTPCGRYKLTIKNNEQHQGFGVCLFGYNQV